MFAKEETRDTAKKLSEGTTRLNLIEQKKLMEHLNVFYQDRQVPYDRRLIIQSGPLGLGRVESQGAELQKIAAQEVKQQRLQEYQEEMREFALFLKKGVNLSIASSKTQDGKQREAAPVTPSTERIVVDKAQKEKADLSEVKTKLEKVYLEEERPGLLSMSPFWLACARVFERSPEEIAPIIQMCNPSWVKRILDTAVNAMEDENGGYSLNISSITAGFGGTKLRVSDVVTEEVMGSIAKLTKSLDAVKPIKDQIDDLIKGQKKPVENALKDYERRLALAGRLLPASLGVMDAQRPDLLDPDPTNKVAWIVIGQALTDYLERHFSKRMTKKQLN